MTVVVKENNSGYIYVFVKGADDVIFSLLAKD